MMRNDSNFMPIWCEFRSHAEHEIHFDIISTKFMPIFRRSMRFFRKNAIPIDGGRDMTGGWYTLKHSANTDMVFSPP
jgi:hypothetical protein